jgi:hypothetical protein
LPSAYEKEFKKKHRIKRDEDWEDYENRFTDFLRGKGDTIHIIKRPYTSLDAKETADGSSRLAALSCRSAFYTERIRPGQDAHLDRGERPCYARKVATAAGR